MACPHFLPSAPHHSNEWIRPPRATLGEIYAGVCCAQGLAFEPGDDAIRSYCNNGYASDGCAHFPAAAECDAMRYSIAAVSDGWVEIQYIFEKNHAPLRHGRAEYLIAGGELAGLEGIPAAQGRAFVESYLRRRLAGSLHS